jgi:hypothetical protein
VCICVYAYACVCAKQFLLFAEVTLNMTVPGSEYTKMVNPEWRFQLYVSCKLTETKKMKVKSDTFCLVKPPVEIEVRRPLKTGQCYV